MGPKMSNTHDGDEKIPTPSTLGRIRVKKLSTIELELRSSFHGPWMENLTRDDMYCIRAMN